MGHLGKNRLLVMKRAWLELSGCSKGSLYVRSTEDLGLRMGTKKVHVSNELR